MSIKIKSSQVQRIGDGEFTLECDSQKPCPITIKIIEGRAQTIVRNVTIGELVKLRDALNKIILLTT